MTQNKDSYLFYDDSQTFYFKIASYVFEKVLWKGDIERRDWFDPRNVMWWQIYTNIINKSEEFVFLLEPTNLRSSGPIWKNLLVLGNLFVAESIGYISFR